MPHAEASIDLISADDTSATFHVHDEDKKDLEEYYKWIGVIGKDGAGVPRTSDYKAINWPGGNPPADDATETVALSDDPSNPVTERVAYVAHYPALGTPVSNLVTF